MTQSGHWLIGAAPKGIESRGAGLRAFHKTWLRRTCTSGAFCWSRVSVFYFGMLLSISCMIGRLKLSGSLHAVLKFLALSSNLLMSITASRFPP
jgi:hypothetical protein